MTVVVKIIVITVDVKMNVYPLCLTIIAREFWRKLVLIVFFILEAARRRI